MNNLSCEQVRANIVQEIVATERDYVKHLKDVVEVCIIINIFKLSLPLRILLIWKFKKILLYFECSPNTKPGLQILGPCRRNVEGLPKTHIHAQGVPN